MHHRTTADIMVDILLRKQQRQGQLLTQEEIKHLEGE